jgi:ATP-dependent exoDNAse (exonuclease V) alpha subunit
MPGLAKDFKISLPIELSPEQNKALILDFAKQAFVSNGMIVDLAIHDIDTQPHSHIKTTTRELTPEGFGKKLGNGIKRNDFILEGIMGKSG